ncbi:tetratricopeptide repeat protein [Zemynaea arenosa]|nr:tetratricopeptide repeat protein [Massilia arenosa]
MNTRLAPLAVLLAALLGGCASAPEPAAVPYEVIADAGFAPPSERVTADDVFALSPAMQAYLRSPAFTSFLREHGPVRGLIAALYTKGELRLDYDATVTRPAAGTYAARSGNCMSLVLMTAAFARALNLDITFQSVLVDETWTRNGTLYLASTHVNLVLGKREWDVIRASDASDSLVVDFLPPEDMTGYRTVPLPEAALVALYLNNRAAEALAAGRVDDAYWWARAAVLKDPRVATVYNTLGVIYTRHGNPELAERSLRTALQHEPGSLVAMQNLVPVLRQLGRVGEADALAARAAALHPEPPFYFFDQGRAAADRGDWQRARDLFARETRRAPWYHEFHFWLAVASYQLGDTRAARAELERAFDTSTSTEARNRYAAKLNHLRAGAHGRQGS